MDTPPPKGLPPNATCVFKGTIYEVWQWQQKMYDGSVATFEKLRRPDSVDVIAVVDNTILVELQEQPHRKKPFLSLPGGRCDDGEDPLESAKRELHEETGYDSQDWTLWKRYEPHASMIWNAHVFIARGCVLRQQPTPDAGERITLRFLSFDEFLSLADDPLFRHRELALSLLRARLHAQEREVLHQLLFPQ